MKRLSNLQNAGLAALAALMMFGTGCDTLGIGGNDEEPVVGLYPVELEGRWGYVNANGRMVVEPRFTSASEFQDGVAPVRNGNWGWGFITPDGEYLIEPQFSAVRHFSEGLAAVRFDGRWGYINREGTFVINPALTEAYSFADGRAFVRTSDWNWEYIDKSGDVIRTDDTPRFDENNEGSFNDGLALVRREGTFGYIDTSTRPFIPLQYTEARAFSDGRAAIKISDRWGFIDRDKNTVIDPQYISAGSFMNGLAPVRASGNSWGFIDRSGRLVIQEQYEEARSFSESRAAVLIDGRWGFIDTSGNLIGEARYDEVRDFKNGLARVYQYFGEDERMGYIDRAGDYVWFPTD